MVEGSVIFWLKHCGSWFGFDEPASFMQHKDGGYFASKLTSKQIHAIVFNGTKQPLDQNAIRQRTS